MKFAENDKLELTNTLIKLIDTDIQYGSELNKLEQLYGNIKPFHVPHKITEATSCPVDEISTRSGPKPNIVIDSEDKSHFPVKTLRAIRVLPDLAISRHT